MSGDIIGNPLTTIGPTGPDGAAGLTGGTGPTGPSGGPTGPAGPAADSALWVPVSQRLHCYLSVYAGAGVASASATLGRLYASPFALHESTDFDLICAHTAAATAANFRLGVYDMGADGLPDALILDAGVIATASSAFKSIALSPNLTLASGRYFLAFLSDTTISMQQLNATVAPRVFGIDDGGLSIVTNYTGLYRTFAYAALPDPFGTITAYQATVPIVALRAV